MFKAASICLWISGLGFGLPGLYGTWYFYKNQTIWTFMGFPTYGNGPFLKMGMTTSVPLLAGFVLVCFFECYASWDLWKGTKDSAFLSFAIISFELFYFIGFALPLGPPLIAIRAILLILTWRILV